MTTTDRDIRDRVAETLADNIEDYDVDAIVRDLIADYDLTGDWPTTTFEAIPHDDYWDLVTGHAR